MPEPTSCCRGGGYCDRCDLLVGIDGLHVLDVVRDDGGGLVVDVEPTPGPVGRPACSVLARGHGRREVELHRRIARGPRNRESYRLRMLLIAGGLPNLTHAHPCAALNPGRCCRRRTPTPPGWRGEHSRVDEHVWRHESTKSVEQASAGRRS